MKARYSIIVPAHNEFARIEATIRDYANVFYDSEVIVVLNGCTDGTLEIVKRLCAEFPNVGAIEIAHPVGKGGAVRAGFCVASAPIVGYVDADHATAGSEMRRLCEMLGDKDDGVIASRWIPGAVVEVAQSFRRRLASRVFNGLVRLLFGLNFSDTQCGAKVFRADSMRKILPYVETANFAFDVDVLFAMKSAGMRVIEAPTIWRDIEGSRVRLVAASSRMLASILRLRIRHSFLRIIVPFFDRFFPTRPMRLHDGFSILIMNWRDPKHPQAGGAETYLFEMAKRWVAWGHRVEWLTAGFKGCVPTETLDGVQITRVGRAATVYLKVPWAYLSRFRDRFDAVIDAENGIPFFSPLFSLKTKICLMFHVHKRVFLSQIPPPISWMFVWLETRLMPYVYRNSRFVTISQTTRDEMIENRFSRHPIEIVHSGVDPNCAPGPKAEYPLISYVGRLKRYKRIEALIRAFANVRAQLPQARLMIAGSGDQEEALRDLVSSLKLDDSVEILGYVDGAKKVEILQQSWLFVTPSSMEGWGIAAIEANACGTPALAYDVPGLREAIVDGTSGLIVPEGSDLTEPMLRVLANPALREELSRGALVRGAQFSWTTTAERFLGLIMRNVAGNSFSLVRVGDHWRIVKGTCVQSEYASCEEYISLSLQPVEPV